MTVPRPQWSPPILPIEAGETTLYLELDGLGDYAVTPVEGPVDEDIDLRARLATDWDSADPQVVVTLGNAVLYVSAGVLTLEVVIDAVVETAVSDPHGASPNNILNIMATRVADTGVVEFYVNYTELALDVEDIVDWDLLSSDSTSVGPVDQGFGATREQARVDGLILGDSIAEGSGTDDPAIRWLNLLQDMLRTAMPTTGIGTGGGFGYWPGWYEVDAFAGFEPVLVGSPTENGSKGLGLRSVILDNGMSATWDLAAATGIRVWFSDTDSPRSLAVAVDDPAPSEGWLPFTGADGEYALATVVNANTVGASGTFELGGYVIPDDATPASTKSIGGWADKVRLELSTGGRIRTTVNDGSGHLVNSDLLSGVGIGDGDGFWVRSVISLSADTVTTSYSLDPPPPATAYGSVSWSALGGPTALSSLPVGVPASTTSAIIGNFTGLSPTQTWDGEIHYMRGMMNGAVEWEFIGSDEPDGALIWRDNVGEAWSTVNTEVTHTDPAPIFVDLSTGDADDEINFADIDIGASGAHEVAISNNSGSLCYLHGIQVFDGDEDKGIQLIDAGHAGYNSVNFSAAGVLPQHTQIVQQMNPGLVILQLGVNDRGLGVDPADYRTNMEEIIDAIRVGDPAVPIIVFISWEPDTVETYDWSEYVAVQYALADEYTRVSVVDFSDSAVWPQPGTTEGDASGYYSDQVHPSEVGSVAIADQLLDAILNLPTWATVGARLDGSDPTTGQVYGVSVGGLPGSAETSTAITVYGPDADIGSLPDVGGAYPMVYTPVPDWDFEPGTGIFAAGAHDGKVAFGTLTASGNSFQGSYDNATLYLFDPDSLDWTKITQVTDLDIAGPVGTDGFTRGDVCSFHVAGDKLWATVAIDYSNWEIATNGRYPAYLEIDVDTGEIGPGSMTIEEMKEAATADAEVSFPDTSNIHAETYAQNRGMFNSDTLPNGWVVVCDYVSGQTGVYSGGVKLLDEDGAQQCYLQFPNMETAEAVELFFAIKFIHVDQSSTDPTDMRAMVSSDTLLRGTSTQLPFAVQEISIDASVPSMDFVTAPILAAVSDETAEVADYLGAAGGQYDSAGTAWIHTGEPTVGFGFAMKPMLAFLKTGTERSWTALAPPDSGWENRYGEFRLQGDYQLGVLNRASSLMSGQYHDPNSGGQLVVGYSGILFPFVPDSPHVLRATFIANGDFTSNITGWANYGLSGSATWDASDGGRLVANSNGATAALVWQSDSAGVFTALPADSVGQSLWATARFKPNTTERAVDITVNFYDEDDVLISGTNGPETIEVAGEYVTAGCAVQVPEDATQIKMFGNIRGTPALGEIHYTDEVYCGIAPVTHLEDGNLELTDLPLHDADLRWPAGAGINQAVDDNRVAWLPMRTKKTTVGSEPPDIAQYVIGLDLAVIFGDYSVIAAPDFTDEDQFEPEGTTGTDPQGNEWDIFGEGDELVAFEYRPYRWQPGRASIGSGTTLTIVDDLLITEDEDLLTDELDNPLEEE